MVEQVLQSDAIWTVVTALVYASLGGAYAYSGYRKHDGEAWDWEQAKYPVGFATVLGVVSGLLMMSLGLPIISTAFGAAMLMTAVLADQLRQMIEGGHNHYRTLLRQGVPPDEAAARAAIAGAGEADLDLVISVVEAFTATHGTPSRENVEERRDALRDAYEEGGLEQMADESAGFDVAPEAIDEGMDADDEIDEGRRQFLRGGSPAADDSADAPAEMDGVVRDGP